jgi:hypothetical protein
MRFAASVPVANRHRAGVDRRLAYLAEDTTESWDVVQQRFKPRM